MNLLWSCVIFHFPKCSHIYSYLAFVNILRKYQVKIDFSYIFVQSFAALWDNTMSSSHLLAHYSHEGRRHVCRQGIHSDGTSGWRLIDRFLLMINYGGLTRLHVCTFNTPLKVEPPSNEDSESLSVAWLQLPSSRRRTALITGDAVHRVLSRGRSQHTGSLGPSVTAAADAPKINLCPLATP